MWGVLTGMLPKELNMQSTYSCDCAEREADANNRAHRAESKVQELTELLNEATKLLFVEGGKPSKDLFGWWFRRDFEKRRKA